MFDNPLTVAAVLLAAIAFLINIARGALDLWQRATGNLKENPPPAETYRTRRDCIAIHEKDRAWIKDVEKTSRRDLKAETKDIHDRVDALHNSMNSQFREVAGQLGDISGQIKKMGR